MVQRKTARGAVRTGLLVLASCLAAALAFDVLAYFFLPASLAGFAPNYRLPPRMLENTRGYYRADPAMGADIVPSPPPHLRRLIPGVGMVSVTANDLGCRDPRSLADIRRLQDYTYFAGDSFTWGFTRASHSFPRAYERASGNPALNCGVGGTGQWHQLQKFRKTAAAVGRYPRLVVIGLFSNDMADDVWHPEYAVVQGLRAAAHRPVHRPSALGPTLAGKATAAPEHFPWFWRPADLERLAERFRWLQGQKSALDTFHTKRRAFLERHSLLYQICLRMRTCGEPAFLQEPALLEERARMEATMPHYLHSPYTRPNREALRAWARHARQHGYRLTAVLIPDKHLLGSRLSRGWREGLRAHLAALGIPHLDFAEHILAGGLQPQDLYLRHDDHLSEDGNRVLGEWLAEQLP